MATLGEFLSCRRKIKGILIMKVCVFYSANQSNDKNSLLRAV